MYGLITNGILEQKQEAKDKGFVLIPDDAVCGQITTDGGKTFTSPAPTPPTFEQRNADTLSQITALDIKRIRPLAEGDTAYLATLNTQIAALRATLK